MKFKVDRDVILKAMAHVQGVVEKRNTIPILANVLIGNEDGNLVLAATDLEMAIQEKIPANISIPGTLTVPAAVLYEILRRLPAGVEVEFSYSSEKGTLALKANRYSTSLIVLPAEDFPRLDAGKLSHGFTVPAASFQRLIDRVRFAISTEETRYYLNGIYFHLTSNSQGQPVLRTVATDGHRLARTEDVAPDGSAGMPSIILPRKLVTEIRKLLDGCDEEAQVAISLSETRIKLSIGNINLISKLIDGTYPDYQRVIPTNNSFTMKADKKSLTDAISRVSVINNERHRPIKLDLEPGSLRLTATSPEQGSATEDLDEQAIDYDGPLVTIGFQSKYLTDVLDHISDSAVFSLEEGNAPVVIKDSKDDNSLFVLMPMRV